MGSISLGLFLYSSIEAVAFFWFLGSSYKKIKEFPWLRGGGHKLTEEPKERLFQTAGRGFSTFSWKTNQLQKLGIGCWSTDACWLVQPVICFN